MLTPYLVAYKFYYNNELLSRHSNVQLRETPRQEEFSGSDFEGLWNLTYKWAAMIPFNMYEFKKGKKFLQHYDALFSCITEKNCKPWKFIISSVETTITMKELMQFESEDVIRYLKERGMTACPMNF